MGGLWSRLSKACSESCLMNWRYPKDEDMITTLPWLNVFSLWVLEWHLTCLWHNTTQSISMCEKCRYECYLYRFQTTSWDLGRGSVPWEHGALPTLLNYTPYPSQLHSYTLHSLHFQHSLVSLLSLHSSEVTDLTLLKAIWSVKNFSYFYQYARDNTCT